MARTTPHDLHQIQERFNEICILLKGAGLDLNVFFNC